MSGTPGEGLSILAPAKLNLGLRVTGRREDGLHTLESLFVPLDLADEIDLRIDSRRSAAPEIRLRVEPESAEIELCEVSGGRSNLAHRAAQGFLEAAGLGVALSIRLRKRIPVSAGLGGGSSDAGAVLRGLSQLFPGALPSGKMHQLALGLGADVSFFLAPCPALVSGIGDIVTPIPDFPRLALVLANPSISLATAAVYEAFDAAPAALTPPKPGSTMRAISELQANPSALENCLAGLLENDLEPAALCLCPAMGGLSQRIRAAGVLGSGMSGSGATVFGVFADSRSARRALERLAFESPIWARVAESSSSRSFERSSPGASPNW